MERAGMERARCFMMRAGSGMVSAKEIVALQDRLTREWHEQPEEQPAGAKDGATRTTGAAQKTANDWLNLVAEQHRANFDLWHIEDEARVPGASDREVAAVKRRIDQTNQRRNDLMEELDRMLLDVLAARGLPNPDAALHSESPGLIVDRLSILALKIYHTREEAQRPNAPEGHGERNRERLAILEQQRADLADCLDSFWRETLSGTRGFKLYRQMKMYNDPSLNPAVYKGRQ
jgi:hypothetical protein